MRLLLVISILCCSFGDSALADIKITDATKIPVNSKFIINPSLIGSSNITIEPSSNTIFLTSKDTARGLYLQKGLLDDMISDSARREKIQQSLDKIGEGIKELVEASRDTTKKIDDELLPIRWVLPSCPFKKRKPPANLSHAGILYNR